MLSNRYVNHLFQKKGGLYLKKHEFVKSIVDEYTNIYLANVDDDVSVGYTQNGVAQAVNTFLLCWRKIKELEVAGQTVEFPD